MFSSLAIVKPFTVTDKIVIVALHCKVKNGHFGIIRKIIYICVSMFRNSTSSYKTAASGRSKGYGFKHIWKELLRVSPSLNFGFRPRNSGMRPPPLDLSFLKTPGLMVGIIDSNTRVKLQQFSFFGMKILCGRFSTSRGWFWRSNSY